MEYDTGLSNNPIEEGKPEDHYYYADHIRILFFTAAIIMLILSPFFREVIAMSIILVIFGISLIILAGITNRKLKTVFFINTIVSLFIVLVLEFIALNLTFADHPFLVILNQILAFILVIALYFNLRTIRGFVFK